MKMMYVYVGGMERLSDIVEGPCITQAGVIQHWSLDIIALHKRTEILPLISKTYEATEHGKCEIAIDET